jgi:hypothetical protein
MHIVPYKLTGAVVNRMLRDEEEEATDKLAVGFLLFPTLWLAEGLIALRLGGPWVTALLAIGLLPLGFLALAWRERIERLVRDGRAFRRDQRQPDLLPGFREKRQALVDELAALGRLVLEVS